MKIRISSVVDRSINILTIILWLVFTVIHPFPMMINWVAFGSFLTIFMLVIDAGVRRIFFRYPWRLLFVVTCGWVFIGLLSKTQSDRILQYVGTQKQEV